MLRLEVTGTGGFCFFMDFSLLSPLEFFVGPKNVDGRNNKVVQAMDWNKSFFMVLASRTWIYPSSRLTSRILARRSSETCIPLV